MYCELVSWWTEVALARESVSVCCQNQLDTFMIPNQIFDCIFSVPPHFLACVFSVGKGVGVSQLSVIGNV
jgi:hypothetical protein